MLFAIGVCSRPIPRSAKLTLSPWNVFMRRVPNREEIAERALLALLLVLALVAIVLHLKLG
jgi:hypothetical protein